MKRVERFYGSEVSVLICDTLSFILSEIPIIIRRLDNYKLEYIFCVTINQYREKCLLFDSIRQSSFRLTGS